MKKILPLLSGILSVLSQQVLGDEEIWEKDMSNDVYIEGSTQVNKHTDNNYSLLIRFLSVADIKIDLGCVCFINMCKQKPVSNCYAVHCTCLMIAGRRV